MTDAPAMRRAARNCVAVTAAGDHRVRVRLPRRWRRELRRQLTYTVEVVLHSERSAPPASRQTTRTVVRLWAPR